MGKLTDVELRNWIKAGQPVAKADEKGLAFTLSAKGTAAWMLRYRFGGKARELTLGRYPDISIAKARELAAEKRVAVSQGVDVVRETGPERIGQAGGNAGEGRDGQDALR